MYYLSQSNIDFYIPYKSDGTPGYEGRAGGFPWDDNVIQVPADRVKNIDFDCILFQNKHNFLHDQYQILTERQRALPKVYVEHNPPMEHPANAKHYVDDPNIHLVHVSHFNSLMWDSQNLSTSVINHGVLVPKHVSYTGELEKGVVIFNKHQSKERAYGFDILETVRKHIPIDLVEKGEVQPHKLHALISKYRFLFNPTRYARLDLIVLEAMMLGMPIIGLGTTTMATTVQNGRNGYCDTNIDALIEYMQHLLSNKEVAMQLSVGAKHAANEQFPINRFAKAWESVFKRTVKNQKYSPKTNSYTVTAPISV